MASLDDGGKQKNPSFQQNKEIGGLGKRNRGEDTRRLRKILTITMEREKGGKRKIEK
jgi:hypothetical protein